MTNNERKQRLIDSITLLSIPGIGRGRFRRLVDRFGSPGAALAASAGEIEAINGISADLAKTLKDEADPRAARETSNQIEKMGWDVRFDVDPEYPTMLREIDDRPPILFQLGKALEPDEKFIAIVGTRHATERGRMFAATLAADLARAGITIVSGMAEGIDAAAHRGALDAGGRTVAVWGTSLDIVYPSSNRKLAERIKEHGAIFSEYLPNTAPDKSTFPDRNRIISGMSDGIVVIEAGARSGALITARYAIDQNRDLFAVPGHPSSAQAEGTNGLIKKGAVLLTDAEDIFRELPRLKGNVAAKRARQLPDLNDTERTMVELLADGPVQVDHLSRKTDLPVPEILGFMLALEMKGVVQELSGKRFVLVE